MSNWNKLLDVVGNIFLVAAIVVAVGVVVYFGLVA